MNKLKDDPRSLVNSTFDKGIKLNQKDLVSSDRKKEDPTSADKPEVAHGKKSIDSDIANKKG